MLCADSVELDTLRLTAISGMPMRFASTLSSTASSATSGFATTVRLGRLLTSSLPLRSRMRPRGAPTEILRVRLDSAW